MSVQLHDSSQTASSNAGAVHRAPNAKTILGLGIELYPHPYETEDLAVYDVGDWSEERHAAALELQRNAGLLLESRTMRQRFSAREYPKVITPQRVGPVGKKDKQKNIRRMRKANRQRNRKK